MRPIALFLIALITLSACRKDRDNEEDPNQLSGLAAFLNGEFDVTQADYTGTFNAPILPSAVPLNGTGEGTQGYYNFNAPAETVEYNIQSSMEVTLLGQTMNIPILVDGNGTVDYVSETRFIIDDPDYGPMTYDVNNKTNTTLRATTRYEVDTMGGQVDLLLDIYLEKK